MMPGLRPLALATCLAGVLSLTGCEQAQPVALDHQPQRDADGRRRSMVLDTPLLSYLKKQGSVAEGTAWYDGRNDRSPAAVSGYEVAEVQRSVTVTRDRQYHVNGRVHDQFYSTTHRSEYRESGR